MFIYPDATKQLMRYKAVWLYVSLSRFSSSLANIFVPRDIFAGTYGYDFTGTNHSVSLEQDF